MPSALKLAVVVSKYTLLYNVTSEEVSHKKIAQQNFRDAVDERKNEMLLSCARGETKSWNLLSKSLQRIGGFEGGPQWPAECNENKL